MKRFTLAVLLSLVLSLPAMAQVNTLVMTTLAAAISDANQTKIIVTSATGISASPQTLIYIDREAMRVVSVSSTTVTVRRGTDGTAANPHINGAMVLLGRPDWFYSYDPSGACTTATTHVTPWLNLRTGNQWLCSSVTLNWVPGFGNTSAPLGVTTAVASVAGATLPSGPLFHVTGTNQITTWTIPVGFPLAGGFCVIPDAAFTTATGGNIAEASTGDADQMLCFVYDKNTGLWYSSY